MTTALVRAELRDLSSPDVGDLEAYAPGNSFGFLLQALVGPRNAPGEESFDCMVCTPEWFAANMNEEIISGRHFLFVKQFNYWTLKKYIESYCDSCQGETWEAVATKLSRLGHWEFEDYNPRKN